MTNLSVHADSIQLDNAFAAALAEFNQEVEKTPFLDDLSIAALTGEADRPPSPSLDGRVRSGPASDAAVDAAREILANLPAQDEEGSAGQPLPLSPQTPAPVAKKGLSTTAKVLIACAAVLALAALVAGVVAGLALFAPGVFGGFAIAGIALGTVGSTSAAAVWATFIGSSVACLAIIGATIYGAQKAKAEDKVKNDDQKPATVNAQYEILPTRPQDSIIPPHDLPASDSDSDSDLGSEIGSHE